MSTSPCHQATSSRLTACPATAGSALGKAPTSARSVAVRPAPTGRATPLPLSAAEHGGICAGVCLSGHKEGAT
jgi:hypothetical protein